MGEIVLGDLDEELLRRPGGRAAARGGSSEEEAALILRDAPDDDIARFRARARTIRERYRNHPRTDSVALLREDRGSR